MGITAKINTETRLVEYEGLDTDTASVSVDQSGKSISVDVKKVPGRMQVVHNGTVVSYDGSSDQVFNIDEEVAKGADLTQEISDRKSADESLRAALTKAIDVAVSDGKSADESIKASVSDVSLALSSAKSELTSAISAEESGRMAADKAVIADFDDLRTTLTGRVNSIDSDVVAFGKRLSANEGGLSAEISDRKSADEKLAADVSSIEQALPTIDEGLEALDDRITAEVSEREEADESIKNAVSAIDETVKIINSRVQALESEKRYLHTMLLRIEDISDVENFQATTLTITNSDDTQYSCADYSEAASKLTVLFGSDSIIAIGRSMNYGLGDDTLLMRPDAVGICVSTDGVLSVAAPNYYGTKSFHAMVIDSSKYAVKIGDFVTEVSSR